ncbi:MAG: hypothetical protein QOH72_5289 [Solirubrobacteraceae bacterium]|nr:hypothetical protein [Solirubrobacteraceae bacterium]
MNLLSAGQLRFLARIKGLRPNALLSWGDDAGGWSLEVAEPQRDEPTRPLFTARLGRDGTVETPRQWL